MTIIFASQWRALKVRSVKINRASEKNGPFLTAECECKIQFWVWVQFVVVSYDCMRLKVYQKCSVPQWWLADPPGGAELESGAR